MKVTLNLEKRYVYAIVALILVAVSVLVVNAIVTPNPGHSYAQVGLPTWCSANQILKWDDTNEDWICGDVSAGGSGTLETIINCTPAQKMVFCPSGYLRTGCSGGNNGADVNVAVIPSEEKAQDPVDNGCALAGSASTNVFICIHCARLA